MGADPRSEIEMLTDREGLWRKAVLMQEVSGLREPGVVRIGDLRGE